MACSSPDCGFNTPELHTQELVLRALEAHVQTVHQVARGPPQTNQLFKHRSVPIYGKNLSLKDYIILIRDWSSTNQDSEANKQHLIIESLQRNDKRSEEAAHINSNSASLSEVNTVEKLIQMLEDKFKLTKEQEFDNDLLKIRNLKTSDKEDLWTELEEMMTKWNELEVDKNTNFMFWRLLTIVGRENSLLTPAKEREIGGKLENKTNAEIKTLLKQNYKKS